jgi:N6-L-threonylcarbamoyladenine synthase
MKVLGIETSCDETAICLIDADATTGLNGAVRILGNAVHSQIPEHAPYGGVFPMLAKREHEKNLPIVLDRCLSEAKVSIDDIDLIAVTVGPGLEPALWTGIVFAKELAAKHDKQIVPCNHMEGHILTALIRKEGADEKNTDASSYTLIAPPLPALSLLISGGHTQIVLVERPGQYKIVGETKDDAVGECFDKVARTLGLQYPGGPKISKLAAEARAEGIESPEPLPRPMIASKDLDFSFSGLKTAVLYLVQRLREKNAFDDRAIKGICRETEDAVTEVLISKMRDAVERFAAQSIVAGGGVIANSNIREHLQKLADDSSIPLLLPQFDHSTDNGLMIALAGFVNREKIVPAGAPLKATGTLPLGPRA